ncbi:MAG: DUF4296 domain-containing protein [Bacteroidetes bacterium]|nr:DUF4296 domain-containing protein [Bacteroidota bacterium]
MKKIITLFCIVFLSACTSIEDRVDIPDTVLSQQKMSEVLVDVHLLEASLNVNAYSKGQVIMNNIQPDSDILKKNAITKEQYDSSFNFYAQNPILLAEVYQLVLNNLSKMQAEVMTGK